MNKPCKKNHEHIKALDLIDMPEYLPLRLSMLGKWKFFLVVVVFGVASTGAWAQSAGEAVSPATVPVSPWRKVVLNADFTSECVAVGDFNGDKISDIVAGPHWYAGPDYTQRSEIFPANKYEQIKYSNVTQPCFVADFNGDGLDDVFYVQRATAGSPGFPWQGVCYENPGKAGGEWKKQIVIEETWNEAPTWGDVNGDGRAEFIVNYKGRMGYYSWNPAMPAEVWKFHPVSGLDTHWGLHNGTGFGDIRGNGKICILANDAWWEPPVKEGESWRTHYFPFAECGASMFVRDIDGDGLSDVLTVWHTHKYGLVWWKQMHDSLGEIRWQRNDILPVQPNFASQKLRISQMHALEVGDFGDGMPGIVTGKRFWAHGPKGDVESDAPAVLYWFEPRRVIEKRGKREITSVVFQEHLIDSDSGVGTQIAIFASPDKGVCIVTSNRKGTNLFYREK